MSLSVKKVVDGRDFLEIVVDGVGAYTFVYAGRPGAVVVNAFLLPDLDSETLAVALKMSVDVELNILWSATEDIGTFSADQVDAAIQLLEDVRAHSPSTYLWFLRDALLAVEYEARRDIESYDAEEPSNRREFLVPFYERLRESHGRIVEVVKGLNEWAAGPVISKGWTGSALERIVDLMGGDRSAELASPKTV